LRTHVAGSVKNKVNLQKMEGIKKAETLRYFSSCR
jgi:hypothetical protein